jgi:Arm DNA-binding domain
MRGTRKTLTDRLLQSLKPRDFSFDVMDALVPGLAVRVLPSGHRTFVLVGRFAGRRNPTRRALGAYGELTLEKAREKARDWLGLIQRGVDPQTHEERQRQAERRQQHNTFAAVAEDFIKEKLPSERKGSQFSILAELPVSPATARAAVTAVSANRSNGWRKAATTSPFSQVQFDSTKFNKRRFSRGCCFANTLCALRASSRSCTPSSM